MSKKFKIKDRVLWSGQPENIYEVIGDRENPYDGRSASPFHEPIKVTDGNDYLLKRIEFEIEEGQLEPFVHAPIHSMEFAD